MEALQLPLAEIRERYTWSEVVLMGWRSQEQSYNFEQRQKTPPRDESDAGEGAREWTRKRRVEYEQGEVPEGLPDRFFDEEGQVNLSKVKAKDALQYMSAIGIKIPMMGRR